jgi:hypothetical protein
MTSRSPRAKSRDAPSRRIRSERTKRSRRRDTSCCKGQDADPRGGELDRQGQPVEQRTTLADGFALGGVGHEVVAARLRAMHEKIDCIAVERQGLQRKDASRPAGATSRGS